MAAPEVREAFEPTVAGAGMILIVVRHVIRPEHADGFPRMVEDFTAATRAEPGNISFEWSRSTDDPAVYFLVEVFRDTAAGEAHVASSHFKTALARLPGLLAGPPQIIHADIPAEGWSAMAELQPGAG
jgi:quinol monooxygenase YgiN